MRQVRAFQGKRMKIYRSKVQRQHSKLKRTFKYFTKARLRIVRYNQLREQDNIFQIFYLI